MTAYPSPEYLDKLRQGDEWAIPAILLDHAVALLYLSNIAPELVEYLDTPSTEFVIKRWAQTAPDDLLELQALGNVSVGVVTAEGLKHSGS